MAETLTDREKIKKYEGLFDELMNKVLKKEGKIVSGPDNTYYKVKLTSGEEIIARSPRFKATVGQSVIVAEGVIVEILPESLKTVEEEQVEFKKIAWGEIGGMKSQIEAIQKKVEYPMKYKHLYKEFNLQPSKGILLYGPAGCGKTLIAKAIASTLLTGIVTKNSFVYIKGGEILDKFVGESERRIKNLFENARNTYKKTGVRPIIFIDEAEAIMPPRGSRTSSDVDTTIVPTFLSEMDGFEGNNPFVILATNFKERIDEAIQRPGRIDLKIYIGRPTKEDAVDIFKIHLAKTKVNGSINTLAKESAELLFEVDHLVEEVSGALIENIVNGATENAIVRKIANERIATGITIEDIQFSIKHQ